MYKLYSLLNSAFNKKNKDIKKVRKLYLTVVMLVGGLIINSVPANVAVGAPTGDRVVTVAKPEVWGYDLRDHESIPQGFKVTGLPYHTPDGDAVFKIGRCIENCHDLRNAKYEYAMLWFLAGALLHKSVLV